MFSEKEVTRTKEMRGRLLSYDVNNYVQILWDKKGKAVFMTSVIRIDDMVPENNDKVIPCYIQAGVAGKTYTAYCVFNMDKDRMTFDFVHPRVATRNEESGAKPQKIIMEFEFTPEGTRLNEWRKGKKKEDLGHIYPDIFTQIRPDKDNDEVMDDYKNVDKESWPEE